MLLQQYYDLSKQLITQPLDTNTTYGYYETPSSQLTNFLMALYNQGLLLKNNSVIDVGCGLGVTLFNLKQQFETLNTIFKGFKYSLTGVEIDQNIKALFDSHFKTHFTDLNYVVDNAFDIDYKKYSLVYMYAPLKANSILELYKKIAADLRIGSVLYEAYNFGTGPDDLLIKNHDVFGLGVKQFMTDHHIQYVYFKK